MKPAQPFIHLIVPLFLLASLLSPLGGQLASADPLPPVIRVVDLFPLAAPAAGAPMSVTVTVTGADQVSVGGIAMTLSGPDTWTAAFDSPVNSGTAEMIVYYAVIASNAAGSTPAETGRLLIAAPQNEGGYRRATISQSGQYASYVKTGADSRGWPLIVTANYTDGTFTVRKQTSVFGTFDAEEIYTTGSNVYDLYVLDWNGDGCDDAIVFSEYRGGLVFLGCRKNQTSVFEPTPSFTFGAGPSRTGAILMDADGDGVLEFGVQGNYYALSTGIMTGQYSLMGYPDLLYYTGKPVGGDGFQVSPAANGAIGRIFIMDLRRKDAFGNYDQTNYIDLLACAMPTVAEVRDITGDGLVDILVGCNNGVGVFPQQSGRLFSDSSFIFLPASGSFNGITAVQTGGVWNIVAADEQYGRLRVFEFSNNSIGQPRDFPAPDGTAPFLVAQADLNRDHVTDLIAGQIYYSTGGVDVLAWVGLPQAPTQRKPPPQLSGAVVFSPASLTLDVKAGRPSVQQQVQITNDGAVAMDWTAATNLWGTVIPPSGSGLGQTEHQVLTVSVSVPAGIQPGTYHDLLQVSGGNSPRTIPITYRVDLPPLWGMSANPTSFDLNVLPGASRTVSLILTNSGANAESYSLGEQLDWLSPPSPPYGNLPNYGDSAELSLEFSAGNLAIGTYTGKITIWDIRMEPILEIPVTMHVVEQISPPKIYLPITVR